MRLCILVSHTIRAVLHRAHANHHRCPCRRRCCPRPRTPSVSPPRTASSSPLRRDLRASPRHGWYAHPTVRRARSAQHPQCYARTPQFPRRPLLLSLSSREPAAFKLSAHKYIEFCALPQLFSQRSCSTCRAAVLLITRSIPPFPRPTHRPANTDLDRPAAVLHIRTM